MKKVACVLIVLLCLVFQGCEKTDYQESDTSLYANFPTSMETENTVETECVVETENTVEKEFAESEEERNYVNIVVAKNQSMIEDYLRNFSAELKWFAICFFDFTKDGKNEIILSKQYLAAHNSAVISQNYVYDRQGNELFTFLSGAAEEFNIYTSQDNLEFYINGHIHWGSQNDTFLYYKIAKQNNWENKSLVGVWDMRKAGTNDDSESCPMFRIPLENEQNLFYGMYDELIKIRDDKTLTLSEEEFKEYTQCYENLQENQMDIQGIIYCTDDKIIMERNDKETDLF